MCVSFVDQKKSTNQHKNGIENAPDLIILWYPIDRMKENAKVDSREKDKETRRKLSDMNGDGWSIERIDRSNDAHDG